VSCQGLSALSASWDELRDSSPFTSTRCVGCLETAGQSQYLTWSIAEGLDFRIFLVILIILGAAVIGYLAGLHRHVTGTASLFASVGQQEPRFSKEVLVAAGFCRRAMKRPTLP